MRVERAPRVREAGRGVLQTRTMYTIGGDPLRTPAPHHEMPRTPAARRRLTETAPISLRRCARRGSSGAHRHSPQRSTAMIGAAGDNAAGLLEANRSHLPPRLTP